MSVGHPLQEITIRPAPELEFESDTTTGSTIVDSNNNTMFVGAEGLAHAEGTTTFQPAKKQKVAHNPSEDGDVVAVLGLVSCERPNTTRTITTTTTTTTTTNTTSSTTSNNEEYVY